MRDNEQGDGDGTASRIHGDLFGANGDSSVFLFRLFLSSLSGVVGEK